MVAYLKIIIINYYYYIIIITGFPPIREIREKFVNFFQSGKSGKNRGFQAQSGKKFANQGIFSSLPKLFLLIMFSLAWVGLGFQDSSPC